MGGAMEELINISPILSLIISFCAFSGAIVSTAYTALTYRRDSMQKIEERTKKRIIKSIGMRAIVLWEQSMTIIVSIANNFKCNKYMFDSYKLNAKRLEEALDDATKEGIIEIFIGSHTDGITLYSAFIQSLRDIVTLSDNVRDEHEWVSNHYRMGMLRLFSVLLKEEYKYSIPQSQHAKLNKDVNKIGEFSWNYIYENTK
jgi:hypothetical protein